MNNPTAEQAHLTAHGFNVAAAGRTHTRHINGKLGCTIDHRPDGWAIGASGKTRFGREWSEVQETIENLKNP